MSGRFVLSFLYSDNVKEGHAGEANTRISKGIPVGRPRTVELRNSHLSYVITWYKFRALRLVLSNSSKVFLVGLHGINVFPTPCKQTKVSRTANATVWVTPERW